MGGLVGVQPVIGAPVGKVVMFDNLSIRSKLWGLVTLASIASGAIVAAGLWLNYQRMHEDRVQSLRFMVEAALQEPEARAIFAQAHGSMDEALFARTMLYGVADHLRWGLIGFLLAKVSTRPSLEFLKYGSWRFFHCRQAVREPRFAERLRRV